MQKQATSRSVCGRAKQQNDMARKQKAHPAAWKRSVTSRTLNKQHKVTEENFALHVSCKYKCSTQIPLSRAVICEELNGIDKKADQDTYLLATLQRSSGGKMAEYYLRNENGPPLHYKCAQARGGTSSRSATVYDPALNPRLPFTHAPRLSLPVLPRTTSSPLIDVCRRPRIVLCW